MNAHRLIKHNPLFLSDSELEEAFVVRTTELEILADQVRANAGEVNQHTLVLGPRGMGKTMLMRRLALLVRSDERLNKDWYPIVAPEEIYDAATEGEIWLAVLKSVADQQNLEGAEPQRWQQRHEALVRELDEERLRTRALGALLEFSHERGKRLLVLIENLQMLLGEQFAKDADWDLRETLLNRPEIMLVLTATTRFEQIEHPAFAAYELFRELKLEPLSTGDCRRLWLSVAGQDLSDRRIRPMEILTGGNPRLLAILATFAPGRPLEELTTHLAELIDDHTPFLKSNIDALPPQERRVFVNLARLWEPSTARQVGQRCRLSSNATSAVLQSLLRRGAVVEQGKEGRGKLYQVAERIYCIYHLMRLAGSEADRMRAFVRFMVPLYGEDSLARALAEAACRADVKAAPGLFAPGLFDTPGVGRLEEALEAGTRAVAIAPEDFYPRHTLASVYGLAGRWGEALDLIESWLDNQAIVESHLDDLLALLIDAAADGQAERALQVIAGMAAERAMEPLVAALKEIAGQKYRAPQEVEEVKKDVLARIEERRRAREPQRRTP